MGSLLQKAILLVEIKRRPAIGPPVVHKQHLEVLSRSSPPLTLNTLLNIFSALPTCRIAAPILSFLLVSLLMVLSTESTLPCSFEVNDPSTWVNGPGSNLVFMGCLHAVIESPFLGKWSPSSCFLLLVELNACETFIFFPFGYEARTRVFGGRISIGHVSDTDTPRHITDTCLTRLKPCPEKKVKKKCGHAQGYAWDSRILNEDTAADTRRKKACDFWYFFQKKRRNTYLWSTKKETQASKRSGRAGRSYYNTSFAHWKKKNSIKKSTLGF